MQRGDLQFRVVGFLALTLALTGCFDNGGPSVIARGIPVSGVVEGLAGAGLVLQNNGGDDLAVSTAGVFSFSEPLAAGARFSITVRTQPSFPAQNCTVANGSGAAVGANVINVTVTCSNLPVPVVQADAGARSASVAWTQVAQADRYDLVVSSARGCPVQSYTSCPDGALIASATSPHTLASLRNGVPYYFQVETLYTNGARGLSSESATRPNALSFDGAVEMVATAADGTVYIGGGFTRVGVTSGSGVPVDAITGRLASPDFPLVDGIVRAAVPDGAGGWYIGGSFSHVGGVPRGSLAHIRADNSVDPDWGPQVHRYSASQVDSGAVVFALAISAGTVYVGGAFTAIDGAQRASLAAISADGTILPWNPSANYSVNALALSGNTLYVGGEFSTIGGTTRTGLAAFNADGALLDWSANLQVQITIPGTLQPGGFVHAIAVAGSTVYVAGRFSAVNGVGRASLAAIDADGTLLPWAPGVRSPCRGCGSTFYYTTDVSALVIAGSTIYVGGNFDFVNGAARNRLAALDMDGTLLPWSPNPNDDALSLTVAGSTIYVGGFFTAIDGVQRNHVAAIDADGRLLPWNPDPNDFVDLVAIAGGTVYVGGRFTAVSNTTRNHLAAIGADGALSPWNPDANDQVLTLAVAGNTLYAGGRFTAIGGVARNHLAAIDANGELQAWDPGASQPDQPYSGSGTGFVSAIAVSGGTVYLGGLFTTVAGAPRQNLAAVDGNGMLLSWAPSPNNVVQALGVIGNNLYVGGAFTALDTIARNHLAAIAADGAILPWDPAASDGVSRLAVSGSTIYAAGGFTTVGGARRNGLAAIDTDGTVLPWAPAAGTVRALAVSNTTLYVGGLFGAVDGVPRNSLAAFDQSGGLLPWNPNESSMPDFGSLISALAASGGTVYAGGQFGSINGTVRGNFAAIDATSGELVP